MIREATIERLAESIETAIGPGSKGAEVFENRGR
jgi:hypothetical protein